MEALVYTELIGRPKIPIQRTRRYNLTLRCSVAVPVLFCLVHASVQAETRPLELKWGELAATVQGH